MAYDRESVIRDIESLFPPDAVLFRYAALCRAKDDANTRRALR